MVVIDPKLDLVIERDVDIPSKLIWEAWTKPEHLKHWFVPKPWQLSDCEIDLRPGGIFRTVMCSPEGEEFPGVGCYLEIVEGLRLSWTNCMEPGFRPVPAFGEGDFPWTGIITIEPTEKGAKYTAIARHASEDAWKKHYEMGFLDGWGTCFDQLVEYMRGR
ncbi:SRPBCC family protein [Pseudobacteriovorax antillogorgiicola]|uniref:Uncharacterized conserved protein YndB, AHSA1/START domain n=1 Tax=Pseudobacteriovorax antillogorgiicola TaxID=1513793 RepID=A0A1Y6BK72_9BACT|nr:SRPBCC family protein [Pseudobacteriovorax antillogorgiicola]TCS55460.1 uncharacterized protein YndB with AHSA1/START domain [Pseudobacteriovorax antillogorgiicola]SMF12195.1 Uncharacterized conserved protein YndB, AHSA1/START domain [Pseudobacteriovorax antillogorgiicola]